MCVLIILPSYETLSLAIIIREFYSKFSISPVYVQIMIRFMTQTVAYRIFRIRCNIQFYGGGGGVSGWGSGDGGTKRSILSLC